VSRFDFGISKIIVEIDDCNLGFIDQVSLKRFLKKCGVISKSKLVYSIIRRLDMDQDARLCHDEFVEGMMPIERFTKGSLTTMKGTLKKTKKVI
jgi:Ca2+-binding EF-hand superfamily protein